MPHDPGSRANGEGHEFNDDAERVLAAEGGGGNGNRKDRPSSGADSGDEPIGYGRPPRKHRFKPGQSGNPKGRAKGAKGMKSILRKEFSERVRITENGKTRTISKMELMVKRLAEKGGKGDFKSITKLIDLGMMVLGMEDETSGVPTLTRDEQAIIDQAIKRRRALAGKDSNRRSAPNRKLGSNPPTEARKGNDK